MYDCKPSVFSEAHALVSANSVCALRDKNARAFSRLQQHEQWRIFPSVHV